MGEPVDTVIGGRAPLRLQVKQLIDSSSDSEHDSLPASPTSTTSAPPSTPTRSEVYPGHASVGDRVFQHELGRVLSSIDTNTRRSRYYDTSISRTSPSKATPSPADGPYRSLTRPQAPTPGSEYSVATTPSTSRRASAVISSGSIAPEGEDGFWPTSPTQRRSIGEPADWSLSDSDISDDNDILDRGSIVDRAGSEVDTGGYQAEQLIMPDGDEFVEDWGSELSGIADVDATASFGVTSSDEEAIDGSLDDAFPSPPSSPVSLSTIYEGSIEYATSAELLSLHSEWEGVCQDGDSFSSAYEGALADSQVALQDSDDREESSDSYIVEPSQHIIDLAELNCSESFDAPSGAAPITSCDLSRVSSNTRYESGPGTHKQQYQDGSSLYPSIQLQHAGQQSMFKHELDRLEWVARSTPPYWDNEDVRTRSDRAALGRGRHGWPSQPTADRGPPLPATTVESRTFRALPSHISDTGEEVADLRAVSFGRSDDELEDRLTFTPPPFERHTVSPRMACSDRLVLDQTHITPRTRHRRSRSATVEAVSVTRAKARELTEVDEAEASYTTRARDRKARSASAFSNREESKERWTASETLAILHGWSEEEAMVKELELRYQYKDMAGTNTQSAAFIEERIRELEDKIACSTREKRKAAEMAAESTPPASPDSFWAAKDRRQPLTSVDHNQSFSWRDQESPKTPTPVGVRIHGDHLTTTGHSRNGIPGGRHGKRFESEDPTLMAREQASLRAFKFGCPTTRPGVGSDTHERASLDSFKFGHPTTGAGIPPPLPPRDRKPNFSHGRQSSSSLAAQSSVALGARNGHGRQPSFTAEQMDAFGFVDPKTLVQHVRTPHKKRMRLGAPPMEDIIEYVVEEDSLDSEDWPLDSIADISPSGTPSTFRRRLSIPPSLQGLVEEEGEELSMGQGTQYLDDDSDDHLDDNSDDHMSFRPYCRRNRRTMEDALRAQIARGRSSSLSPQHSINYSVDGGESSSSEVNRAMFASSESDTDDSTSPIVLSNNAIDEAMHDEFLFHSKPHPAHSVFLFQASAPPILRKTAIQHKTAAHAHYRARSCTDPSSLVSLAVHTSTMPATRTMPRKMTPAMVAFRRHLCSEETRAFRDRVDMKDGGLTIDMIVHGLMTTPVRPFPQRPPFEPTPAVLRRAPSPPPVSVVSQRSVSAPAKIPQRHSSQGAPTVPVAGGQANPCHEGLTPVGEESGASERDRLPHRPLHFEGEKARQHVSLRSAPAVTSEAPTPPRRGRVMSLLKSICHPLRARVVAEGLSLAQKHASPSKPLTDP